MSSISTDQYDADYFLRGRETGKSLYQDYRWMPDLTIPMVNRMIDYLGIEKTDTILDFGCARGYVVRAFQEMGYTAFGYDTSEWAIKNADELVADCVTNVPEVAFNSLYDWVIAKDVLEHIEFVHLTVEDLMKTARKGVFVVVPLSDFDGTRYVIPDYEKDRTHVQRLPLVSWLRKFVREDWEVTASYRVPGIKDNWYQRGYERGNGFITARRVVE